MDREVVGTGLAYGRRYDFDDPEGERDFWDFVQHSGKVPVIRTIQDKPSRILEIVRRPDQCVRLVAVHMLDRLRLLPRGLYVGSSQSIDALEPFDSSLCGTASMTPSPNSPRDCRSNERRRRLRAGCRNRAADRHALQSSHKQTISTLSTSSIPHWNRGRWLYRALVSPVCLRIAGGALDNGERSERQRVKFSPAVLLQSIDEYLIILRGVGKQCHARSELQIVGISKNLLEQASLYEIY
jgi:hypothetical protein